MTKNMESKLNRDIEDIEDVLKVVERSYNIKFAPNELAHLKTFGELCDYIVNKIDLSDKEDCTSQQGFYKLRDAIVKTQNLDNSSIGVDTKLDTVFPSKHRRRQIVEIENYLDFKLDALRPKYFITFTLVMILVISFAWLFVNWKYGLPGIILSVGLLNLTNLTAKEFKQKTVGGLADMMTQRNYLKSRRNPLTINKSEVQSKIEQLFIEDLGLTQGEIKRETLIT